MKGSVRKRSNGKYEFYFDVGKDSTGKRKRFSKSGFSTEKLAREELRKALEEFENTGSVFKENNMSIAELMKYYMDNYVKLKCKSRSIERYDEVIRKHIIPELGHYYIKNLTPRIIQSFLDLKYNEGYSKKSMQFFLLIIKQSFKLAVHPYGFLKENPSVNISLNYKFDYKKERTITKEDLYVVLEFLQKNHYVQYILFMIAWGTGMRRSEILGLTWDNVDLENKVIYVRQQQQYLKGGIYKLVEPKSKAGVRDIIIGDKLVTLLKMHKIYTSANAINNNFVCINNKGEWMKKHNVNAILATIRNELNISIGLHDIRFLHGTILCQESANIKGIQQRLGHDNVQTSLNIYIKATNDIKKNTADIFESVL